MQDEAEQDSENAEDEERCACMEGLLS